MNHLSNLVFTANVIIPMLSLMVGGFVVRKIKLVSDQTANQCVELVFNIFLPVSIFNSVRRTTIAQISDVRFFIYAISAIVLSFVIFTVVTSLFEKDNSKRGVIIQGICRSNYAIFGLPLVTMLHPDADTGLAAMLVAIAIPLFNILSIIVLTVFGNGKVSIIAITKSLITNKLIIATFFGAIMLFASLELPEVVDSSLNNFAAISTPLALFMLGAKFDLERMKSIGKQIVIICFGRLVILPVILIAIAVLLDFREVALSSLMILFCAPTAGSSYVMAKEMGGDADLAAASIVATTFFSIITIFIAIFVLNGLNLI